MMRILVDGRALADASAYRGIGTYLRNVVGGLGQDPEVDVTVVTSDPASVPAGARARRVRRFAPGRFAALEHDLLLPFDLRRCEGDVLHSPATDPPRRCPRPWVQTLHDLVPLLTADTSPSARRWAGRAGRLREAAAVIAVSRWVAESAVQSLGLDPGRVHVVPHGVSDVFTPAPVREQPESPYVLLVGEYDPRKRHAAAFGVIGALAAKGLPHRLVVTGRVAPWFESTVQRLVAAAPAPERIEIRGFVDEPTLVSLYQQADALIVTSSMEGFGFPALEAMACGTPVVAFDNSATAEVVEGAGVLVADGDVDAMATELASLLTSDGWRSETAAAGVARAAEFTWAESVRRHREVFAAVVR